MKKLLYLIFVLYTFSSCEKIIATDISGETPVLLLPQTNDTIQNNPVHFKWEEMEGAEKYHLQIVTNGFLNPTSFVLDSIVYGTDFYIALDSNQYEFRMWAHSANYRSDTLGPIVFWVGTTAGVSTNTVTLSLPNDLDYMNSVSPQFQWNTLSGASSYEISIRSGSQFETASILHVQNNISTSVYTSPISLTEGVYTWGVKAFMNGTETLYSTRILYIDQSDPNQALLSLPSNGALLSSGLITFSWSNGTDPGTIHSPVTSFLEIADDLSFSNVLQSAAMNGSTTNLNLSSGTYYWRVTNTDEAGNTSSASSTFQVSIF